MSRRPRVVGATPGAAIGDAVRWQMLSLPGIPMVSDGLDDGPATLIDPPTVAAAARWVGEVAGELGRTAPDLMVNVPSPASLAASAFGPAGMARHRRRFRDPLARVITQVLEQAGTAPVFQIEMRWETATVARAGPLGATVARLLAGEVRELVAACPPDTRFGVHLCPGGPGAPSTLDPLVRLGNAVARRWPAGRSLEFVHLPLAPDGTHPPLRLDHYWPLRWLRLPAGVRLVAGMVEETQPLAEQLTVLAWVEQLAGPVDLSATCGLGNRTRDRADAWADRMRLLCDHPA